MPDTRESSRATRDALFGQSLRLGTVRDGGPQALEMQVGLRVSGKGSRTLGTLRKSRGLLTHRPGRCNIANLRPWLANLRQWLANRPTRLPAATNWHESGRWAALTYAILSPHTTIAKGGGCPCAHRAC